MVSVGGNSTEILLADVEHALSRRREDPTQSALVRLFEHWLLGEPDSVAVSRILAEAGARTGAQQDYQTVATLSYGLLCGSLDDSQIDGLRIGLERLSGRSPFVDDLPMAFCSDVIAVLSWAMAARHLSDSTLTTKLCQWMAGFVPRIYEMERTEDWQRCILKAADSVLSGGLGLSRQRSGESPEVSVALARQGLVSIDGPAAEETSLGVIQTALNIAPLQIPLERAILLLAALESIKESAPTAIPGRMQPETLIALLERFPAGLRNWTWETKARTSSSQARQWNVDHEYHVQNMLWALLAPIFPDLDDEQYLAKIGQKNPRADLFIPSMKIMIEAKFIRKGKPFQGIIDEIASDASLYSAMGNEFSGLIAFVWDNSGRTQEHDYLKQGLAKLNGVLATVVVTRPADWEDPASSKVTPSCVEIAPHDSEC